MNADNLRPGLLVRWAHDSEVYRIGVSFSGGVNFRVVRGTSVQDQAVTHVDRCFVWVTRVKFDEFHPAGFPIGAARELRVCDLRPAHVTVRADA